MIIWPEGPLADNWRIKGRAVHVEQLWHFEMEKGQ